VTIEAIAHVFGTQKSLKCCPGIWQSTGVSQKDKELNVLNINSNKKINVNLTTT